MYLILSYLKFIWQSTNQHGVHSPFVYNFVTKCLYDRTKYADYDKIKSYRSKLLKDDTLINVTDFGSGSRIFNSSKRKVSAIAKHAGASLQKAKLLYRIVKYFKIEKSLELGTSLGISAYAMSVVQDNSTVISIEGCPNIFNYTQNIFKAFKAENIVLKNNTFKEEISDFNKESFDLIYIDGHHAKAPTLDYFEALLPFAHNDTILIIDDIYWSKDMTQAWELIKAHKYVTVTVDCFFLGLVFLRKEQVKEHFKIRL